MSQIFLKTISTPIGLLVLESTGSALCAIRFSDKEEGNSTNPPEILQKAGQQLKEYFDGARQHFSLELSPKGTGFQKQVWEQVEKVPFGATSSYLDIALTLGGETFTRAVGAANGKNPIPIIIPCHRVIGSNGKLTGYAGGLERKKWLLLHEKKIAPGNTLF